MMHTPRQLARNTRMLFSRRLNRSFSPPDRVSVNVTLRCNLTCTMCTTCYDSPELSLDEIKGIIDQTAEWGVEVFNPLGGEPFMRADIEEILSYAVRHGFYVTVTTNGTLITEKRAQAIAAIPSDRLHFNFSLDGAEATHDAIRSQGMWKRAIQGYQRIREADTAAGNPRRKILANTILHARNVDDFEAVLDEQEALGFDGVQILNLFRQGPDVPAEAANLWFHPVHMTALETISGSLARRAEAQGVVGYRIQNSPQELRQIPRYYRDDLQPLEAPCWAGWKELYINADGAAIMCDGKLDFLNGTFGNVREQTLKELWNAPALRERRQVVKTCTTPCVQGCYLRPESDSATELLREASSMAASKVLGRVRKLRSSSEHHPDTSLRLELTDTCPCGWAGCETPEHRWAALIRDLSGEVDLDDWQRLRDGSQLDFGRGFMGFEVVRSVLDDIREHRIRFGSLAVRWRGEPLLHPEAEPILRTLLDAVAAGHVADRLVIETDGRFLSEGLAALATSKASQTWILDVDRGGWDAVNRARERLLVNRHDEVRIIRAVSASGLLDVEELRSHGGMAPIGCGSIPQGSDVLWVRRTHHAHYREDQEARSELSRVAAALGLDVDFSEPEGLERRVACWQSPTISWDGKVTVCPWDSLLGDVVGDVIEGSLTAAWHQRPRDQGRNKPGG